MKVPRRSILTAITLLIICAITAASTTILATQIATKRSAVLSLEQTLDLRVPNEAKALTLGQQIKDLADEWQILETAVPARMSPGDFLEQVSEMLTEAEMPADNIEIGELNHHGNFSSLPIHINFAGVTDTVHEFLARLETLPRLVRVDRLQITKNLDAVEDIEDIENVDKAHDGDKPHEAKKRDLSVQITFSIFARSRPLTKSP